MMDEGQTGFRLWNQNVILWNLTRKIWHQEEVQTMEPHQSQCMTELDLPYFAIGFPAKGKTQVLKSLKLLACC